MSGVAAESRRVTPTPFADGYRLPESGRPSADTRLSLAGGAWRAFDVAIANVSIDVDESSADYWTTADTQRCIAQLQTAVKNAAVSAEPRLRQLPSTISGRRLLDAMRRAFVREVEEIVPPVDSRQVIQVLSAIESVCDALEEDEAQRFASQLSHRTAQQLVLEVAHDMRSPLGSILLLSDQLRTGRSGGLSAVQQRQLSLIYSATFGLSSLVSDLLELAHGGDRLLDHEPIPFSIADVLQSVRDMVQPLAEEKGLALQFSLPESDSRMGYPAALNRVLLNLTTNALKFTAAGTVSVGCRQTSRTRFEFSVADTGCGIPPKVMEVLFDAFRPQAACDEAQCTFSSAGLGLLICRKLVNAMDGQLVVESGEGTGTRFHFELDLPAASQI